MWSIWMKHDIERGVRTYRDTKWALSFEKGRREIIETEIESGQRNNDVPLID